MRLPGAPHQAAALIILISAMLAFSFTAAFGQDYALNFDGSGTYVSAPLATTEMNTLTLEAWVKWNGSTGNRQYIVMNGSAAGGNGYSLTLNSSNFITIEEEGNLSKVSTKTVTVGTWTHIAAVRSSSAWSLYVNGVLQTLSGTSTPFTPAGTVRIGASDIANTCFNGTIDEVRISDIARYSAAFAPLPFSFASDAHTMALYHCNEGSGQVVADASAGGHDGQRGSTSGSDANDPAWVTGAAPIENISSHRPVLNFDGVDDYVQAPLATTTTGDLTLEAWVKWSGSTGLIQYILLNGSSSSGTGYGLLLDGTDHVCAEEEANVSKASTRTLTIGQWTHVAAVRSSSQWKLFVNGVGESFSGTSTPFTPTGTLKIGRPDAAAFGFNGQIADVRISNIARYSADFTPSYSSFAPDQYAKAIYHLNEGAGQSVTDASGNGNNGQLGSTNGTDSEDPAWLTSDPPLTQTQGNALQFGVQLTHVRASIPMTVTDNLTMEAWVKWLGPNGEAKPLTELKRPEDSKSVDGISLATSQCIILNGNTASSGYALYLYYTDATTTYRLAVVMGSVAIAQSTSKNLTVGAWTHVAVERKSGTWWLFKDGVAESLSTATPNVPAGNFSIGTALPLAEPFKGYIDEVRISNIARYNGNFTPSIWPFTSDANTVVLYHFDEGSGQITTDASGHGNNGQLGVLATADGYDPTWGTSDAPLPIVLSTFAGEVSAANSAVTINWTTVSEENSYGFYIERSKETIDHKIGPWETESDLIPGAGTSLDEHSYAWTEPGVTAGCYYYRIRSVSFTGDVSYSSLIRIVVGGVTGVKDSRTPTVFALEQNYPNPFNPSTEIHYALPQASDVVLGIYDVLGRKVASLVNGREEAGFKSVVWNATNDAGVAVPSGLYFCRINAGSFTKVMKMMFVK